MPNAVTDQTQSLNAWLHRIPLHRRNPYLNGDFTDGVLVAQVIHHYSKTLVSALDIQRLENNVQMWWDKRLNWIELDPVFAALNIHIHENCLQGIMLKRPGYAEQLLTGLRVQLDKYVLNIPLRQPREIWPPETSAMVRAVSPMSPCASSPTSANRSIGDTPVLRLSNVDYHTQKAHVIAFFRPWGGPTDLSRIYVPISLDTGKMIYEVYVVFDSTKSAATAMHLLLAASAAATGGPPQLLNRRIDLCLVTHDELYVAFFGRTHRQIDETTEFLTEPNKEKMLKLCRSYKNWFNSHTPSRPFEFIISFIELLPWHEPSFAKEQRNRSFELLRLSILTLLSHQSSRGGFPPDLVPRMVEVARFFTEQQQASLTNCLKARQQDVQQRRLIRRTTASGMHRNLVNDQLFHSATGSLMVDEPPMVLAGLPRTSVQQQPHALFSTDNLLLQSTGNVFCQNYAAHQRHKTYHPMLCQPTSYSGTAQSRSNFGLIGPSSPDFAVDVGLASGIDTPGNGVNLRIGGSLRETGIGGRGASSTSMACAPKFSQAVTRPLPAISAAISALDRLQLSDFSRSPPSRSVDAGDEGHTAGDDTTWGMPDS